MKVDSSQESTERAAFVEDGNHMIMEISGGNLDDDEFRSEGEVTSSDESEQEDCENNTTDSEADNDTEQEGSVNQSFTDYETVTMNDEDDEENEKGQTSKKKSKAKRQSMEEKLESLQSSVMAMQELLMKHQGMTRKEKQQNLKQKEVGIRSKTKSPYNKNKGIDTVISNTSETTVYHNLLSKVDENSLNNELPQPMDIEEDQEISFKMKPQRNSSSSEDQIDTSDELIEIDINEKFIADCAAEAERRRSRDRAEKHQHRG